MTQMQRPGALAWAFGLGFGALALNACFGNGDSPARKVGGLPDGALLELGDDSAAPEAGSPEGGVAADAGSAETDGDARPDDAAPPAPAPGACLPTGNMATPRAFPLVVALASGKVLVAGGTDVNSQRLGSAEIYDPSTGAFSPTGSMAGRRAFYPNSMMGHGVGSGGAALLADGRILVAGGLDASCLPISSAEIYDPAAGAWSVTGSMTVARDNATLVTLQDGRVLVLGGYTQGTTCGGTNAHAVASAEIFDPAAGTFTATGSMTSGHAVPAATRLPNGDVLVVGGEDFGSRTFNTTVEVYKAAAGTFASLGAVPGTAGYGYAFPLASGKVLVNGAFTNLGTISLFDPTANTFAPAAADLIAGGNGLLLADGDVFFVTGYPGGAFTSRTELYQASSGTWKEAGSMTSPRHTPGLAELPGGDVLIVGGSQSNTFSGASVLASAEVCHP